MAKILHWRNAKYYQIKKAKSRKAATNSYLRLLAEFGCKPLCEKDLRKVEAAGIEANAINLMLSTLCGELQEACSAKSSALGGISEIDADLATVVEAWPDLTESQRNAIIGIVGEGIRGGKTADF